MRKRANNYELKYVSIADDDAFPNQNSSLTVPQPVRLLDYISTLNSVNGLLCFCGSLQDVSDEKIDVLWNPSVGKTVSIPISNSLRLPNGHTYIGFGVCPNTSDPKLVRINTIGVPTVLNWESMYSYIFKDYVVLLDNAPNSLPLVTNLLQSSPISVTKISHWCFDVLSEGSSAITTSSLPLGSEQPYSPATRPTDYPSTGQYKPSAGNGSVPAPVPESAPVASQSYQYDSNYQPPLRRLQRHKGQQGLLLEHWRLMTFSLL
ncbi:hypothetical protein Tco_0733712 [Tanacetum coccineum]